ncbi:MAG: asparagine synthase (glutamine-hydrolyzing) [Ekhidna sp.]|uniref:asparagine synthase (glutamine-hydrolyzing) n=1 Tax=Ekhidna sp. TaxID=2608089 RepID=UPI0032ED4954
MCGITGFKNFSKRDDLQSSLISATQSLHLRGPDHQATFLHQSVGLGHTRLSIIDTSEKANQPMTDASGRYTLIFNGEIYNYRELAATLSVDFYSTSDTEVLLYLLIRDQEKCLPMLNGFFAFAFYDSKAETLLLARDRMGIKPLHYFQNDDFLVFGSEMKALMNYPIPKKIDQLSLYWYLRLTYLPSDMSMLVGVKKLLPGHFMKVSQAGTDIQRYWSLERPDIFRGNYIEAQKETVRLLEQSVERRMVADVPLGSFLSGGTDSSAVVAMASGFDSHLHTFSIGYRDHDFFDETDYAELVAKKFNTTHTTFSLTNDDLLNSLEKVLDYIDEPFADSSAIPTYILSNHVSKHIKVALSGDGADELFGGYYKHLAFQRSGEHTLPNHLIRLLPPLLQHLPTSRSSKAGNLARRAAKYARLMKMSPQDKYWHLASFNLQAHKFLLHRPESGERQFINNILHQQGQIDLNDFLDADLKLVLPGDMLTKVDLMSMANGLEVRVPFLDKDLVAFARSLPPHFKVDKNRRKTVLQDALEHILPKELHHRPKKGFEVPMLSWMKNELLGSIEEIVFDEDHLRHQGIFNPEKVMSLKEKLFSANPGDVHSVIWTIYVFQKWYGKWFS